MKIRRTCREVTRLVLESEDRPLGVVEKVSLRLHWLVCEACRNFRTQAHTMRRSLAHWRDQRDGR